MGHCPLLAVYGFGSALLFVGFILNVSLLARFSLGKYGSIELSQQKVVQNQIYRTANVLPETAERFSFSCAMLSVKPLQM